MKRADVQYILLIFAAAIIFFIIFNYLRKLHWDIIHNNLFELADAIGGKVIRNGLLSRPIYHGTYNGSDVTVNFSTEKSTAGRLHYMNISIGKSCRASATVASINWVKLRSRESLDDFERINLPETDYAVRSNIKLINKIKKQEMFLESIKALHPFSYIFAGKNGLIFERQCKNLAVDSKEPMLKSAIENLDRLGEELNK